MKINYLTPIKSTHLGCACCPGNNQILSYETRLYYGFGGYLVLKNGNIYYQASSGDEFFGSKTLLDIEKEVCSDHENDYRIILSLPLRGAEWQRNLDGNWYLISENSGFA
ncbi:hypothetical protein [Pedobacter sp. Hv1]|uniref:hypothetical protein n=1 Tax=Pedobacter sp. Hv1 TaxID=1740090 RepID=UPI0006D8C8FD|nr:hypothetical protein [Pedobacter sp. Hv1]KQC02080.1 hypothetical protein AQF98_00465 [Pedobacter sp. Hv1]